MVTAVVLLALVVLMRLTPLGLQMRGAVESRRLVQLDGVNSGRVVAVAWAVSSLMAGLAGVLLAPLYGQLQAQDYATLVVAAFAAAAWAVLRSMPIAALVGILMGVADTVLQGYLPASSVWSSATLYVPALRRPGGRPPRRARAAQAGRRHRPAGLGRPADPADHGRHAGPPDGPDHPGRSGTCCWPRSSSPC